MINSGREWDWMEKYNEQNGKNKGIRKINMKTQLLFNGWWAHYNPNCWFKSSEDTQYLNEKGVMVDFRPKEEGITMGEAYKKSKTQK